MTAAISYPGATRAHEQVWARVATERVLAVAALLVVALHVVDDNFLQPQPGTSAAGHLVSGLVPVTVLVLAATLYGRMRPGLRGATGLLLGFFGVVAGTEALAYTRDVGPSGDDYTGLLSVAAGLLLLGIGTRALWRSRRLTDNQWWRYGRRLLITAGAVAVGMVFLFPFALGYVVTHAARARVPAAHLGNAYENVAFTTKDGLTLKGWYIPSRNGAAVVLSPGRQASQQKRARMLARHGYGVLLFDRRGEGESEGDPNIFGWHGERDIHAAVAFLQRRPDVDADRIGGIGLSVGGEMMIAAAAQSDGLKAIVPEGASTRSMRDDLANGGGWEEIGSAVITAATALFSNHLPPETLKSVVPRIAPRAVFFVYGEHGQSTEKPANNAFYAAAGSPKAIWEVPGSKHTGGIDAQPREYERRVIAFFDAHICRACASRSSE